MAKRVFFSFHYKPDNWRAAKVRNIGVIEGNSPVADNDWETVTKGEDPAIIKWIKEQMNGRSCTVVLVGTNTAGRKWINYEIRESWSLRKGLVGICVHNLLDKDLRQSPKGANPFSGITVGGVSLSSVVKLYDPPYSISTDVYAHIDRNIAAWVDEAIATRNRY